MQKQEILNAVLGYPSLKNKEALYHCPKCNHHKKKLSVNLSKGVFKCWACEFSGKNFSELKEKLSSLVVDKISPISIEINKLLKENSFIDKILSDGAEKANEIASIKIENLKKIIGF